MLRQLLLSLGIIIPYLTANAEEMPVLFINFDGISLTDDYTPGTMKLIEPDGKTTELEAKFKTRGATAKQYSMKPAFNMKLETAAGEETDSLLLGLRKASSFILDAMAIDRICMRNRVCFDIWNSFSHLPYDTDFDSRNGTVGKFLEVYINDTYKGIYCLSDKINRKLLDLKKPQVDDDGEVTIRGVLYKNGTNDIADQNTPGFFNDTTVYVARYHDAWELHEPEDYPSFAAWAPLVDYYDNISSYTYASNHFFEDNIIDYSLFIMVLAIEDNWGYKNKYFSIRNIQEDGKKSKFVVTPWDLDTSLGGSWNGSYYDGIYSSWTPEEMMNSAVAPFSTFLTQPSVKENMKNRWIETRDGCFSVDSIAGRLYDYCNLFESSGAWERQCEYWDQKNPRPMYVNDLRAEIDQVVEWYRKRHEIIDNYFGIDDSISASPETRQDISEDDGPIYDIRGFQVNKSNLRPGRIYIQNGKKFLYKS